MGSTKVELVKDLEDAIKAGKQPAWKIGNIMANAQKGMYHDFDSELATPKMQLHADLLEVGLVEIDQKMQNGDYDDEEPTPEQEREMMQDLLGTHGGQND